MLEIKKSTFDLSWMGLSIFAQKYLHKYEDTYQSFHVKPNGAACGLVRRDMRTFKKFQSFSKYPNLQNWYENKVPPKITRNLVQYT